jgi:uncharacterized protein
MQTTTTTTSAAASITLRSVFRLYAIIAIAVCLSIVLLLSILGVCAPTDSYTTVKKFLEQFLAQKFLLYLLVGFVAQLIDGALGMAYGLSSSAFLMSVGVPPAIASASVHLAEVFTTGASGLSHWKFGNVNKKLFLKLALPGMLGAGVGAFLLSYFDGKILKPYIAAYLLIMGIYIFAKAIRKVSETKKEVKGAGFIALFGGFVDSFCGGGWGSVVTGTIIGRGGCPRETIGTTNAAEFLVAFTASAVFAKYVGIDSWQVVVGLILGGIIAAPFGAFILNRINMKTALMLVGSLIVLMNLRTLLLAFL